MSEISMGEADWRVFDNGVRGAADVDGRPEG